MTTDGLRVAVDVSADAEVKDDACLDMSPWICMGDEKRQGWYGFAGPGSRRMHKLLLGQSKVTGGECIYLNGSGFSGHRGGERFLTGNRVSCNWDFDENLRKKVTMKFEA